MYSTLEYISNIVYFFLGNLQICSESSMYIDCRMFTSLHLVLCKMRASQLFRDVAVQTLSASQAGRWEGCFPNCFFPHFVQILERAWICWWTSVSRPCVLWFLGLTWVQREVSCPKSMLPTSCLWNWACISLHGKVQTVSELSSDQNFQCRNLWGTLRHLMYLDVS